jgi:hypothetical protein
MHSAAPTRRMSPDSTASAARGALAFPRDDSDVERRLGKLVPVATQ